MNERQKRIAEKLGLTEDQFENRDPVAELTAKVDALSEYHGLKGIWNGQAFEVVKDTPASGDYTDPIKWNPGDAITAGLWYYDDDKDLPHEAIKTGTPGTFYDRVCFDFV